MGNQETGFRQILPNGVKNYPGFVTFYHESTKLSENPRRVGEGSAFAHPQ